jgi:hypothetical protein
MSNPSLSTTLTLNLESPRLKHSEESHKLEEQYKQDAYLNQKSNTREMSHPFFEQNGMHNLMCAHRSITHKPTN